MLAVLIMAGGVFVGNRVIKAVRVSGAMAGQELADRRWKKNWAGYQMSTHTWMGRDVEVVLAPMDQAILDGGPGCPAYYRTLERCVGLADRAREEGARPAPERPSIGDWWC